MHEQVLAITTHDVQILSNTQFLSEEKLIIEMLVSGNQALLHFLSNATLGNVMITL